MRRAYTTALAVAAALSWGLAAVALSRADYIAGRYAAPLTPTET